MSAPLFLVQDLPAADLFRLDGPEGHHAATVQRLRPGESLLLSDGRGGIASAVVISSGKGGLDLSVQQRRYEQAPQPRLVVAQGIAKGDRGELAVQAMTEVGVDEILPWAASRSVAVWRGERGHRAREKWVVTAREAAKQSRRGRLPILGGSPDVSTKQLTARLSAAAAGFVLHEHAHDRLATVDLPESGEIVLAIGPEGGIDSGELAGFVSVGAIPVRLGETVLRTSTAGVAALSLLSVRLRRW